MSQRPRSADSQGRFKCPKCEQWKHIWEYYNNKRTKLGISSMCKECQKEYQKYYSTAAKKARFRERERQAKLDLAEQLQALISQPPMGPPTPEQLKAYAEGVSSDPEG